MSLKSQGLGEFSWCSHYENRETSMVYSGLAYNILFQRLIYLLVDWLTVFLSLLFWEIHASQLAEGPS